MKFSRKKSENVLVNENNSLVSIWFFEGLGKVNFE